MREENPHYGEGAFKYDDKLDFGVHHFQIGPDRFSVYVRSIAYCSAEPRAGAVVWRRCADQGADQTRNAVQRAEPDGPANGSQSIR